ncbi:MAG: hypothetical protein IIB59_03960 [Planctomycetes bacterium]|nr:hypothetical protein [Planctomycetota bacterium]
MSAGRHVDRSDGRRKIGVRVIDAPEDLRLSRLRICDLTARVLKTGLRLLGIETIERM